jgi:hypothetical protein
MTAYTKSTNFATKDTLTSGDPLKIVKGTEINTEFDNIQTAVNSKSDTASPSFTGTVTIPTVSVSGTTDSTSTSTGSVVTAGGVGIAKTAYIGTNLSFAGTGNRITGDFSNATLTNRVLFQSSTTNGASGVIAIPNGTGVIASWSAQNSSDVANGASIAIRASDTDMSVRSGINGTGTYLPMTFYTNNSERVRIDTSGNVGIGTISPGTKLDVSGNLRLSAASPVIELNSGGPQVYSNSANTLQFASGGGIGSPTERMRIDSSGNLLVGTTATTSNARLAVKTSSTSNLDYGVYVANSGGGFLLGIDNNGGFSTGSAAGSPYNATTASSANVFVDSAGALKRSTSSLKYKTNVQNATYGLADAMRLRAVTYKGKNDGDTIFGGLIAEEVHEAGLTEFVQYAEDGSPDALSYGNMVSLAFKAIQEQQALIQSLTTRITALEAK